MTTLTNLSDLIFEVKDKITDGEFKTIMDKLAEFRIKQAPKFYRMWYIQPQITEDCESTPVQVNASFNRKCVYVKLDQEKADCINDGLEQQGSYTICGHSFLKYTGADPNLYDDDEMVYLRYDDDQILTYERHCSIVVKLEPQ